jgi:hypothetical protein
VAPRPSPGDPDDGDFLSSLRRALFMRRLRRAQEEQPLPGAVPHLSFRQRRLIRAMLARPQDPWTLNAIWYTFLIMPVTTTELGAELSAAYLANIRWIDGKRCLELTDYGVSEFPGILDLYRSQRPMIVLFRSGPRSAGILWWMRHRDRVWRRAQKHELPPGDSNRSGDGGGDDDSKLLW